MRGRLRDLPDTVDIDGVATQSHVTFDAILVPTHIDAPAPVPAEPRTETLDGGCERTGTTESHDDRLRGALRPGGRMPALRDIYLLAQRRVQPGDLVTPPLVIGVVVSATWFDHELG